MHSMQHQIVGGSLRQAHGDVNAHSFSLIYFRRPVRHFSFADSCESNINEYCSLDVDGGKPISQMTLGEKEQAFLEALSVRFG